MSAFMGQAGSLAVLLRDGGGGLAVDVDGGGRGLEGFGALGDEANEEPREHVAGAAVSEHRVERGREARAAIGRSDDGAGALEHDNAVDLASVVEGIA